MFYHSGYTLIFCKINCISTGSVLLSSVETTHFNRHCVL
uniref:Uncharacterized protein n=1 Tax=Arundo donax TaxID=35708 RepID=A0A0A9G6S7_ARUDO